MIPTQVRPLSMILIGDTSLLSTIPQFGQELEVQIKTYFYSLHCLHKFLLGYPNVPIDILKTFLERSKCFLKVFWTSFLVLLGSVNVPGRFHTFFFKGYLNVLG